MPSPPRRRRRIVPGPVPVNAVKFRDLRGYIDRRVDLIGVVVEFSIPRKCNGTDYFCCLKLIDETQQVPELAVTFFMRSIHSLPHLRSGKDIIVLKNVLIEEYKQHPCVLFMKNDSSFALYDGRDSNNFTEYQAFTPYNSLDCKELIRQLRDWCLQFTFDAGVTTYVRELRNVEEDVYFDLVCKIFYVCEITEHVWVLYVWDGTDAPTLSINTRVVDAQSEVPLQVEEMPLSLDVLRKFPGVGTILRIVAHASYENLGEHFQHVGIWATIRNVSFKHFTSRDEKSIGLWIGNLNTNTKIRLLSENDGSVMERKRNFNYRIDRRMPSSWSLVSEFLTATASNNNVIATLMDLITWPHMVDYKFMTIVRVVAVCPFSIQGRYNVQMTLDDPTARIHGLLCYKDMELFFKTLDMEVITAKMTKLLGVIEYEDSERNPPWIKCCILLHHDSSGRRKFYICDTWIV